MGFFSIFNIKEKLPSIQAEDVPNNWEITYDDGQTETIVAGDFDFNQHDVLFRDVSGYGILYIRAKYIREIRKVSSST